MDQRKMDKEHVLDTILNGEIVVEGRFVDASNATLFAKAVVGEDSVSVIYKPIAGEQPLWDFPDGHLAHREYAAYLFSQELGLSLVPFTTLRDGPFGPGSVQQWIEVDSSIDVVDYVQSSPETLRLMAIFDAIVNNTDRKFGHILITEDYQFFGCDHGLTFHEDDKLRTVLWNWSESEFTETEIALLRRAKESVEVLSGLITPVEIEALTTRIERLLELGIFPAPSELWPPVPWPPY